MSLGDQRQPLLFSRGSLTFGHPRADLMIKKLGVLAVVLGVLAVLYRKAKSLMGVEDESGAGP